MEYEAVSFSGHAIRRMFDRGVSRTDVTEILKTGEVIAEYPDDRPHASFLKLGHLGDRPLHVVAAVDKDRGICHVITVYEPNPEVWDEDFRTRRPR